jgi:O-antigen/teichoic acid export membrane protein
VALAALAPDGMRLWLGTEYAGDSATALRILCAGILINALAQVPYAVLHAAGRPDRSALFHLVELPLHALVLWLLVRAAGVPGAAIAWGLRATLDALLLFDATQRLGAVAPRTYRNENVPATFALVLGLGAVALGIAAVTHGPWRWASVLACAGAGAALGWRRILHRADRDLVRGALPRRVARA